MRRPHRYRSAHWKYFHWLQQRGYRVPASEDNAEVYREASPQGKDFPELPREQWTAGSDIFCAAELQSETRARSEGASLARTFHSRCGPCRSTDTSKRKASPHGVFWHGAFLPQPHCRHRQTDEIPQALLQQQSHPDGQPLRPARAHRCDQQALYRKDPRVPAWVRIRNMHWVEREIADHEDSHIPAGIRNTFRRISSMYSHGRRAEIL